VVNILIISIGGIKQPKGFMGLTKSQYDWANFCWGTYGALICGGIKRIWADLGGLIQ
jgi:hypothetical protein